MPPRHEPLSARDFALLYSPVSQKAVLEALFGVEREIGESLRPGMDHQVAHSRLQWWRDECARAADGHPVHPLTRALVDTPMAALRGLSGFVDVAVWDLASATFETRKELTAYCERWASAITEPFADASSSLTWRTIGAALREIELLCDLAHEAHQGRLRVPLDELDRAKVQPTALAKPPWPESVAEILRARHKALRAEIATTLAQLGSEQQPEVRGLLVWVALTWRSSLRAERALPDRLRPGRLDAVSDSWLAWRVARKAAIGKFSLS